MLRFRSAPAALIAATMLLGCVHQMADPDRPDPARWSDHALTIANLGHATLLMKFFGVRLITDPTLFNRVGLAFGSILTIGPHRRIAPPLTPDQLGPLDVILITHAHMDHLDLPSLKALPKSAAVIACSDCSRLFRPLGFRDVRELRWGQRTEVDGLSITAMGARHWGQRWPYGHTYGDNSYLLAKNHHSMLVACDSAFTFFFSPLRAHPPDVAAFSIGGYNPWIRNHANPEQVWMMFQQTHAHYLVPIHWGTFKLSIEPANEPLDRLLKDAGSESSRIALREIGGTWTLPGTSASARPPSH